MRKLLLSAVFLAALPLAAQAGQPTTVVGGFIAGGIVGDQGSAFSNTNTTNGSGNGSGSSASGTGFSLNAANGSAAKFFSNGNANSTVTMTPFSVTSESNHTAFSAAITHGYDANVAAVNQTFGQSNGNVAFSSTDTSTQSSYQNSKFGVVGALGFISFEGGGGEFSSFAP